ncbi:SpaA isopeptide-forming pilin-related protein, partial [Liquorilactobacillus cacaonum]|uniref:SpaA isopeptide-forming pilin-related protein n=1 Tax=Liquorilactobacillus cacaonum TaxID=483012 RepID=UPI00192CE860
MNFRFFKRLYSSLLIFLLTLQIFLPVIEAETIDSVNSTDDSGINLVSASYNDQKKAVQLSLKVMNSANTNFDSNITISTNNNSDFAVLDSQKLVSTSGKVIGNFKIESNKIRLQINPEVTSENAIIDVPISESQNINMMSFAWQSQTVKAEIASQNSGQSTSSSSSMNSNTSTSNTTVSNIKERSAAVSTDETGNDISQYLPESSKGTIIDSAKISFTDQSGNNVATTDVNAATNINFSFDWSVPNELKDGYSLKGGDYFEFKLPSNVTYTAHSGSLGDYGSFTVSSDGTVRLTFNDNVNDESDVGGTFNYNGNKINVDNPGETTIDVPTTDGSVSVPVTVNTTGGQAISKSGTLDKQTDSDAVTWQVDVNTSRDELKSAQVKENMPDSVSLDSTDVYLLNVGLDGNPTGEGQKLVEGTDYELDSTTGDIQFIGKYADTTQSFRIIYHTTIKESSKPTNGGNLNITNSADLINGDKTSNAKATVDPSYNSGIKKSGYQSGPGKASWTIDYNLSNETLSASQATITDTLDSNSEYDQDSVKVVDANYQTLTEGKDYTLSFDSNSNQMKIEFPNGLSTGVHVTYDTKYQGIIPDNNNQPGSVDVTNNASGNGDNTSASTTINAKGVDKSYSDVDYTNKKLKWTIEFNQDQQYLKDATITDTLGKGLTLLDGDDNFQVIDENTNQVLPADYYTMTSTSADGSNPGQFEVTLNDKLPESQRSDTYKIVYWTSFDYSQMSNSNFDNSVNYTWTDNNGDKHQSSKDTPFYPTQNVINDGTKSGYYNATNKNIYWTVGVNYRGNNLKDAIISDMIQAGQNYVSGSAELYEVTGIDGNGNAQTSSEPVMDQDIVYENGLLTAKLPTGNKTYVLKYQTSLAGTMIQKSYDNTATFTNDGQTEDYQATVSVNEGGDELEKSGSQSTTDSSYVNWTLTLNAAQSTIANASITDTPSANSSVDISTIKIQKAAVNQDGWIWQDTSQPYLQEGTDYKVSQNDDGSFTITFLKTIDAAYYVTYDSLIDSDKATDEVTNTASLSGNGQESISGDVSSSTWVTNSSGSSHASNYEIKLLKVDDTTGSALSGAEFTLTKKNSSSFNENGTTNENGELDFSNLKAGTYYVEETKAPAGYVESDKITQITLDKEHSQDGILTEKITNTEKTGSVVLTKTDADTGKALSQAVFSLFDKAGNKIKDNVTTGTDGKVTVDGLKPGEYYFKETAAPAGYEYDADKEYNFTVDLQTTAKVATVSVTDTEKTGSVVLTKIDADTGTGLGQAVFSLFDKAGNKIKDNVTTGTDGKVTVDGLKPGEYYFKETAAPAGYEYDADKEYSFTVDLQTTAKVATVGVT